VNGAHSLDPFETANRPTGHVHLYSVMIVESMMSGNMGHGSQELRTHPG